MAQRITINLPMPAADLLTGYGAGALIYTYSAASEAGSYSQVDTEAIVSGTEQYEVWDPAGTSATWYKARFGNSGASVFSDYGAAFQATSITAYATPDDLFETMSLPDESRYNVLADYLVRASALIDARCFRSFYRRPQVSGDSTFYLDVRHAGRSSLVAAVGHPYCTDGGALDVVSLTSLWTRDSESGTYAEVVAGDLGHYLDSMASGKPYWPYEDVSLSPVATVRATFPVGRRAVKLVGALGFERVPEMVRLACVDMAREWYRAGPQGGGQAAGVNQFGVPIFQNGVPHSVREVFAIGSGFRRQSWASV